MFTATSETARRIMRRRLQAPERDVRDLLVRDMSQIDRFSVDLLGHREVLAINLRRARRPDA
jgi:hypothetical protein